MGLLGRIFGGSAASGRRSSPEQLFDVRGGDYLDVVGESFHKAGFEAVTGGRPGDYPMQLLLVREPNNPYDRNAVAILTRGGQQLGHLARADAAICAERLDAVGGQALADGCVHRQPEHENWSAVLYVDCCALGLA